MGNEFYLEYAESQGFKRKRWLQKRWKKLGGKRFYSHPGQMVYEAEAAGYHLQEVKSQKLPDPWSSSTHGRKTHKDKGRLE